MQPCIRHPVEPLAPYDMRRPPLVAMRCRLPANEIHVWCADPGDLDDARCYASSRALLAPSEEERFGRYRFERDRRIYLAARALLRTVLSTYAHVAPTAWRFMTNEYGRPELAAPPSTPPLRFSLSKTRGLVVCAVATQRELGVDVENVQGPAPLDVADHALAKGELAALRLLPSEEQSARFFAYWTLKESYVKARGMGLSIALNRLPFVLSPGQPPELHADPDIAADPTSWQFRQLRPTVDHLVAVCIQRRDQQDAHIVLRWLG
jgi:4'-phosphopantetheinyl transferase